MERYDSIMLCYACPSQHWDELPDGSSSHTTPTHTTHTPNMQLELLQQTNVQTPLLIAWDLSKQIRYIHWMQEAMQAGSY